MTHHSFASTYAELHHLCHQSQDHVSKKKKAFVDSFINYWPAYAQSPLESYSLETISSISLSGVVNMNLFFSLSSEYSLKPLLPLKVRPMVSEQDDVESFFPSSSTLNLASLVAQLGLRPNWFLSRVGKICWRRDRLPTPVFLGFPVTQLVKNLPVMQETSFQFLGWEDPLEKGMATHSSI